MQILLTGGAGYIGSHVTVELIAAGYDVVVADNMSNCDMTCFNGVKAITGREDIPFYQIDCCDQAAVEALFEKEKIDAVIHFAAFKAVGESVAEPIMYYRNNLVSFLNILEASKKQGGCNVLFSSSATVYGEAEVLPVTEQTPRLPATSPYGNTKQMCEDILRDAVAATNIKGIALRYFNPIGAHPSALIGELPRGVPQNLVPYVTQTAAGVRECLSIFGDDYPTEDGTCLRDYIDVVDLAKAHVAAVSRMVDGKMKQNYEIFNVGTGRPVSVSELVNAFEKVYVIVRRLFNIDRIIAKKLRYVYGVQKLGNGTISVAHTNDAVGNGGVDAQYKCAPCIFTLLLDFRQCILCKVGFKDRFIVITINSAIGSLCNKLAPINAHSSISLFNRNHIRKAGHIKDLVNLRDDIDNCKLRCFLAQLQNHTQASRGNILQLISVQHHMLIGVGIFDLKNLFFCICSIGRIYSAFHCNIQNIFINTICNIHFSLSFLKNQICKRFVFFPCSSMGQWLCKLCNGGVIPSLNRRI